MPISNDNMNSNLDDPMTRSRYNRLANQMSYYHDMLRASWQELYSQASADPSDSPDNGTQQTPTRAALIQQGLGFCRHIKLHHDIEETIWFPVLGQRMEGFRPGEFARTQHHEIHEGVAELARYLRDCDAGTRSLVRTELRALMDALGPKLWQHLDDEVRELSAENMSKYWTVEEVQNMPFCQ